MSQGQVWAGHHLWVSVCCPCSGRPEAAWPSPSSAPAKHSDRPRVQAVRVGDDSATASTPGTPRRAGPRRGLVGGGAPALETGELPTLADSGARPVGCACGVGGGHGAKCVPEGGLQRCGFQAPPHLGKEALEAGGTAARETGTRSCLAPTWHLIDRQFSFPEACLAPAVRALPLPFECGAQAARGSAEFLHARPGDPRSGPEGSLPHSAGKALAPSTRGASLLPASCPTLALSPRLLGAFSVIPPYTWH